MKILDAQLGKTPYVAGEQFTMGDIPVGVMTYRYWQLVPERPELPHLERWYAEPAEARGVPECRGSDAADSEQL